NLNPGAGTSLVLANNVVIGPWTDELAVKVPANFNETHNLYWGDSAPTALRYDADTASTGKGQGDKSGDPQLDDKWTPKDGSPVIDAGVTIGIGTTMYQPTCNGTPFSYCGGAPDMGALEHP